MQIPNRSWTSPSTQINCILNGSFPSPTFLKAFLFFFDSVSEQLDLPGSFSYWSFFCSTWVSPFFTSSTTSDTEARSWFLLKLSIFASSSLPESTWLLFLFESIGGWIKIFFTSWCSISRFESFSEPSESLPNTEEPALNSFFYQIIFSAQHAVFFY